MARVVEDARDGVARKRVPHDGVFGVGSIGSKDFRYWTGLALMELGRKTEADAVFEALVSDGEAAVETQHINFYGAEGTTGVTLETINSAAYYTQALGQLGLGHRSKAEKLFNEVVRLKPDHLWAHEFLKDM